MVETLTRWIGALSAGVFSKVTLLGTEIEVIVLFLAFAMVFFTFWLGVPQLRGIPIGLKLLGGKHDDPTAPGAVSQFQALSTALSGTIGLGNIAGVAIAIATGGPGAAFWMFVIGFFAMALKATEVTLGLKYREITSEGEVRGGPMYMLKNGLAARGWPKSGRRLGVFYAIFALGGAIPLIQVNQSFSQIADVGGFETNPTTGLIYGFVLTIMIGVVIIGGVKAIARVTGRIVPFMCALYIGAVLVILVGNAAEVPAAFATIVTSAFSQDALAGGIVGTFVVGMRRAVFSSEAGVGTAVIAHSAAKTHHPASEGMVALLEPMLDTMIVCMSTALMIVVTGVYTEGYEDIAMTSAAFASVVDWFPYILLVAVVLFAYSTLIAWGYYFMSAWGYLFGHGPRRDWAAKIVYCLMMPLGSILAADAVVDLIDSLFFLMVLPNVIGCFLLAPIVRREVNGFLKDVKAGRIYGEDMEDVDDETAIPRHD
ncbi:alanine/glycine:cation symporter family protein [Pacificimonas flava]|uniref:Sodium/alanine symporter family protein n=1 Tax=Pacificimonas flava TaxID=1234595 RepID=M2U571_9SPHN|nr:alanine/glycine:cation symporter family protein [Pacificimonas flava]EMD83148.1 sodium/alanine symporter family protein [Pacificimonas flava]MBB5279287.1 AGCS family alanine or glycine:cation symporter [Pacificimonas flava]